MCYPYTYPFTLTAQKNSTLKKIFFYMKITFLLEPLLVRTLRHVILLFLSLMYICCAYVECFYFTFN